MEQDEQELIAQILDGDEETYASLIDRYEEGLYRHCFRFTHDEDEAEDIAHEAFIEAFVHLDRYNPQFRFSTWLYKIATNLALTHLRKRRTVRLDEGELDRIMSDLPGTIDLAMYQELREAVDATGYDGPIEVEIFNDAVWKSADHGLLELMKQRFVEHV